MKHLHETSFYVERSYLNSMLYPPYVALIFVRDIIIHAIFVSSNFESNFRVVRVATWLVLEKKKRIGCDSHLTHEIGR